MNPNETWLAEAEIAARKAGELLLSYLGRVQVHEKEPRDLVTEADIESQKLIQSHLMSQFPDHDFLGEEGESATRNSDFCWIVDPLDGTTNFVHQLPGFAVSIALRHKNEIVAGVVLDPVASECFTAQKGRGAKLNGKPIRCSDCIELSKSLLVCSFSSKVEREGIDVHRFLNVLTQATVRRMGSAAINLAYVAAGRLDGYWASSLKIWDIAAGYLIAQESGAIFSQLDGSDFNLDQPQFAMAANPELHRELLQRLNMNLPD